jgi:hypothetical protein
MANEGFNTFVLGQTPATSAAAADSIPLIQGGATKKAPVSTITSFNIVGPTGGDDTVMLNSAFAGSASRPVFLSFGTYNVSGPLTIADYGVVVGEEINAWDFYNGTRPRTLLQANTANTFPARTAILTLGNYNHIRGFSIFGLKATVPSTTISGVAVPNKAFVTIQDIWVNLCYHGFDLTSDGVVRGSPWGASNIGPRIYGGGTLYNAGNGIQMNSTGGFISDGVINNVQIVSNTVGLYIGQSVTSMQIIGCRLEDQTTACQMLKATNVLINGCITDRCMNNLILDSCLDITVTGNRFSLGPGSGSGGTGVHVSFQSSVFASDRMYFAGNGYQQGAAATSYTYAADVFIGSGSGFHGYFAEDGCPTANTAVFQDAQTQTVMTPLMVHLGP